MLRTTLAGLMLLATSAAAQSPAQLLERGIYAEQTQGNLDAALDLYKQVLSASPAAPHDVAAQARYHLATIHLAKGDMLAAGRDAAALESEFRDFPDLIKNVNQKFAARLSKPVGELNGNTFRHFKSGTELILPSGWTITEQGPSSDGGDIVFLEDKGSTATRTAVWMVADNLTPADVKNWLEIEIGAKARQRHDQGLTNYRMLLDQTTKPIINGHQGLVYLATYKDRNGIDVSEYMTSIYGEHARVFFSGTIPTADLPLLRARLDQIIYSAKIP